MSEPLSFTINVTNCRNCPYAQITDYDSFCRYPDNPRCEYETFEENYYALKPSCPAWQEQ